MKRCPTCGELKASEDFPKNRSTRDGRATYCKPCHAARNRKANERLYGGGRQFQLMRRYGLDNTDVAWLELKQDNRCAICHKRTDLHIDHDHDTGRVRGLLCFNCNRGIGYVKDDPQVLRQALSYVKGR